MLARVLASERVRVTLVTKEGSPDEPAGTLLCQQQARGLALLRGHSLMVDRNWSRPVMAPSRSERFPRATGTLPAVRCQWARIRMTCANRMPSCLATCAASAC